MNKTPAVSPPIKRKRGRPRKIVEVEPDPRQLEASGPIKKYRKPPASRSLITPEKVEELAATRAPIYAIAAKLGTSERSFHRELEVNAAVRAALKRGRAEASLKLALIVDKMIGRDTTMTIMAAKQRPEHGGLGWMDERSLHVDVTGEVTVRSVEGAWGVREAMIAKERKLLDEQVIEAEFSEVKDG